MQINMHQSVKKVAEFMQQNLACNELVPVAEAIGLIAPALWGHYEAGDIIPLSLSDSISLPQSSANESDLGRLNADDDFVAA